MMNAGAKIAMVALGQFIENCGPLKILSVCPVFDCVQTNKLHTKVHLSFLFQSMPLTTLCPNDHGDCGTPTGLTQEWMAFVTSTFHAVCLPFVIKR